MNKLDWIGSKSSVQTSRYEQEQRGSKWKSETSNEPSSDSSYLFHWRLRVDLVNLACLCLKKKWIISKASYIYNSSLQSCHWKKKANNRFKAMIPLSICNQVQERQTCSLYFKFVISFCGKVAKTTRNSLFNLTPPPKKNW